MTDEDLRQIYIQNLPYEIEEEELGEWCATFGRVLKCSLKRDKDGNSRGFGFVTYATIEGHNKMCKIQQCSKFLRKNSTDNS